MKTTRHPGYDDTAIPNLPAIQCPTKEEIVAALHDEAKFHSLFTSFFIFSLAINKYVKDEALCKELMDFITTHPAEFSQIFKNSSNIAYLSNRLSKAFGEQAITYVLDHEEECARLLRNSIDLATLYRAFPNHASVFAKPNVNLAIAAAREERKQHIK